MAADRSVGVMVGALPHQFDLILPCLNEAEALGWVLGRMPPGVRPISPERRIS
jgi:hypothetical protein